MLASPSRVVALAPGRAMEALAAALEVGGRGARESAGELPFVGGWIGWLSYDLGREIEPRAQHAGEGAAVADREWGLGALCRCEGALAHDGLSGRWWAVGDEGAIPELEERGGAQRSAVAIGGFASRTGREAYERAVGRSLEYIRAGDVFQVNVAHRLSATVEGSPRELAARMLQSAQPWYGGYVEMWESGALRSAALSLSPELFLEVDGRRVVTRPIKGTRPAGTSAWELAQSGKDRAELNMIIDLMRNDLGRVCAYGSVRVEHAQEIEAHAGVIHGVATVSGRLREGVGQAELLRATFPPGSVTGAPKVRAMQIIDELEPVRRGPYCGSVGFVSDCGRACWNVAIRTAALTFDAGSTPERARGVMDYSVGAGIVADSDPAEEWRETLAKARMLEALR